MKYFVLFLFAFLLGSCEHVNNIHKYDFNNKKYLFEYKEAGKNGMVYINLKKDTNSTINEKKREKNAKKSEEMNETVAASLAKNSIETKLRNAADGIDFKYILTDELKNSLIKFTNADFVSDVRSEYDYIFTTTLMEYSVESDENGIRLKMKVNSEIIDREFAELVWQSQSLESFNLTSNSVIQAPNKSNDVGISNAVQITELALVQESTLKQALINVSNSISQKLARTLIKDYQASKEK